MYPNPATNNLTLDIQMVTNGKATVRITDIAGRIVGTTDFGTLASGKNVLPIDVNNLNAGTYFVVLTVNDQMFTQKLNIVK